MLAKRHKKRKLFDKKKRKKKTEINKLTISDAVFRYIRLKGKIRKILLSMLVKVNKNIPIIIANS